MPDGTLPMDTSPRIVERFPSQSPIAQSAKRFHAMGMPMHQETGLIDRTKVTADQLQKLKTWCESTRSDTGLEMPSEQTFYDKTFLLTSLWPEAENGRRNYVFGKGIAVEMALRGEAVGRQKRPVEFPYRPHGNFQVYAVESVPDPALPDKIVPQVPDMVRTVFGDQAIQAYPPDETSGLHRLPEGFIREHAQEIDLGGLTVYVPELELLAVDKMEAKESSRFFRGTGEGDNSSDTIVLNDTDAEVLFRQYILDKEKVLEYRHFTKKPWFDPEESLIYRDRLSAEHMRKIQQVLKGVQSRLHRTQEILYSMPEIAKVLNEEMEHSQEAVASVETPENARVLRNQDYFNIIHEAWAPLEDGDIDQDGNLTDAYKEKVASRFRSMARNERENYLIDDTLQIRRYMDSIDERGNVSVPARDGETLSELQDAYDFDWDSVPTAN